MGHVKTVNVWKCDHCGKEEQWGATWRSRLILHKIGGPGPWDEELVACSEACATAIDEKRKWKKLPDKSKSEPAIEIHGCQLQPVHNAEFSGATRLHRGASAGTPGLCPGKRDGE